MSCRIIELRDKQVISVKDGSVLGYVSDIEIDEKTGSMTAIVIPGRSRGFGLFGHDDDAVIPWDRIEVIGNDSILVNFELPAVIQRKKRNYNLFG